MRKYSNNIVFTDDITYNKFVILLKESIAKFDINLCRWCLTPNAILLIAGACEIESIRRWLQWLMATHAKRHHAANETMGPIWKTGPSIQPIQGVDFLSDIPAAMRLLVLRSRLIRSGQVWPWIGGDGSISHKSYSNLYRVRFLEHMITHNLPVGEATWVAQQAYLSGWAPPKPRGRPRLSTPDPYYI